MVGLYVDPPAGAVVLAVDEKTQVQALDRTQLRCCRWMSGVARSVPTTGRRADPAYS